MKNTIIAAVAIAMLPSLALAQNAGGAVGGAVGGAAVGTVVGGPVGTVVGAGIGALVGSTLPAQPSVAYDGQVVVGNELPGTYTYYPVPQYQDYDYVIVNNQRVIVDHRTHKVVRIVP